MKMSERGLLIVLSAPSGCGKSTIVQGLLERREGLKFSVSATTRAPRAGEADGVQYFFKTEDEFSDEVAHDGRLEWARYAGNGYGTPRASVEEHIARGEQVILEIDMQGAFQVREKMPEAKLVFIEPPSMAELERRLRQRGTETDEAIAERMATAELELSRKMEYYKQLVNDDLESAVAELVGYINEQAQEQRQ